MIRGLVRSYIGYKVLITLQNELIKLYKLLINSYKFYLPLIIGIKTYKT